MFRSSAKIGWAACLIGLSAPASAQSGEREFIDRLPDALRAGFLGLEAWQWLGMAALLLLAFIASFIFPAVVSRVFRFRRRFEAGELRSEHLSATRRALALFAATLVLSSGLPSLLLEDHVEEGAKQVLLILRILSATYVFVTLWEVGCDLFDAKALKASRRERNLILPFARRFGQSAVIIFGAVAVAAAMGFNVAGLIAGLGIGGLVIALAAKNSVENVFGSVTVVLDMPFMIGDWIKMGDLDGVVEEINLRSTRLRTAQDSLIIIPNSNLITASIENFGARRFRRLKLSLTLAGAVSAKTAQNFAEGLRALAGKQKAIRKGSEDISLYDLTAQGPIVQFSCLLEAKTVQEELEQRESVLLEIMQMADSLGISLGPGAAPTVQEPQKPAKPIEKPRDPLES